MIEVGQEDAEKEAINPGVGGEDVGKLRVAVDDVAVDDKGGHRGDATDGGADNDGSDGDGGDEVDARRAGKLRFAAQQEDHEERQEQIEMFLDSQGPKVAAGQAHVVVKIVKGA